MINDLELVDAISAIISKEALSIEEIQSRLLPIKVRKPTIKRILENEISYIEKKKKKGIYGDNIVFLYKKLSKTEYRNKKTPKRKKKVIAKSDIDEDSKRALVQKIENYLRDSGPIPYSEIYTNGILTLSESCMLSQSDFKKYGTHIAFGKVLRTEITKEGLKSERARPMIYYDNAKNRQIIERTKKQLERKN